MTLKRDTRYIGAAGEFRVLSELLIRGYKPAKHIVDDGIDIILNNGKTIQVKTVNTEVGNKFGTRYAQINLTNQYYKRRKKEFAGQRLIADFVVVWAVPYHCFYIIPSEVVGNRLTLGFTKKGKYEKYKNKWKLLE